MLPRGQAGRRRIGAEQMASSVRESSDKCHRSAGSAGKHFSTTAVGVKKTATSASGKATCAFAVVLVLAFLPSVVISQALSDVVRVNMPTTGGISLTLLGLNIGTNTSGEVFGVMTPTQGQVECLANTWVSTSSVVCKVPASWGPMVGTFATHGNYTITNTLTYDVPTTSSLLGTNSPAGSTAVNITILGSGYAETSAAGASAKIGNTACTAEFMSDTSLRCLASYGSPFLSFDVVAQLTNSSSDSILTQTFSYNLPTFVSPNSFRPARGANGPTTGGVSLTLSGSGFSLADGTSANTLAVSFGGVPAEATVWTADSSCVMKVPSGYSRNLVVVVSGVYDSSAARISKRLDAKTSFDAPIPNDATSQMLTNYPKTGSVMVTLTGLNLGMKPGVSGSTSIGRTTAVMSKWSSDSTIAARPASAAQKNNQVRLSIARARGTMVGLLSIDDTMVSGPARSQANGPAKGSATLTMTGQDLGSEPTSLRIRVGATACQSATWASDTTVTGKTPASSWLATDMNSHWITVNRRPGVTTNAYTYNGIEIVPTNGPTTGGFYVQVLSWGYTNGTSTLQVGDNACDETLQISSSALRCKVPASLDVDRSLNISIGATEKKTLPGIFSYNWLEVSKAHPANTPSTGGVSISLQGDGFGTLDYTVSGRLGKTACEAVAWQSDSTILCKSPQSSPVETIFTASIARQTSSPPLGGPAFIFNAPSSVLLFIEVEILEFNVDRFRDDLSQVVMVPPTTIDVLSVVQGSIIVTMRILTVDWKDRYSLMVKDLESVDSRLRSVLHVSKMQDFASGSSTTAPLPALGQMDLKNRATLIISVVASCAGTALVIIIIYSGFLIMQYRNRKRIKDQAEEDEARHAESAALVSVVE